MSRPILLLGAGGQLGRELERTLAPLGRVLAATRQAFDLTDLAGLADWLAELGPGLIVNAAAYTAVDRAEVEPALAHRVNAEAVGLLARFAAQSGAWLVHYSSDHVFDGRSPLAYREDDAVGPLNVYGRSKLAGERLIRASGCRHLIFRTGWVYGAQGNNFVKNLLRLAEEKDQLSMVVDQIGTPTSAALLAEVSALILAKLRRDAALAERVGGIYHLQAAGHTSRYHWARHILAGAHSLGQPLRLGPDGLRPISSADYGAPARRPLNSRLDTGKLQDTFGLTLPPWQAGVDALLGQLLGEGRGHA